MIPEKNSLAVISSQQTTKDGVAYDGGVVTYPFKGDQGHMLSSFRKDAIVLMKDTCGGSYTIVREGEAKGRARVAGAIEGSQEIVRERRWGIEFRCK